MATADTQSYLPIWTDGPQGTINVQNPKYGAFGDGVHDDTAAIQAASDAAYDAGGGTVYFPAGTYVLSGEITPKNSTAHVAYVGTGWGMPASTPTGSWVAPTTGTILTQTGTGLSAFHVNRQIAGITIRDLAIRFTAAATGHGIFFDPVSFLSGTHPTFVDLPCVMGYRLANLLVYGHDADHYAYYLGNALNGYLSFLNGAGYGGFIKFYSYHPSGATATYNFGNAVMEGYWEYSGISTYQPGVAVVSFENDNNTTAGTPTLNYLHHRGVLDVLLNTDLVQNLIETVSTGAELGLGDALTIATLVQNDLGGYTATIDNANGGLYVGFSDEIPGKLSYPNQPNFHYAYTPLANVDSLSQSTPGTIQTGTVGTVSAGVFRLSVNLAVTSFTSGTVAAQVTYTSGWDGAVHTQPLGSLTATGETSGTAVIYAQGGTTFTVAIAGTFVATFHSWSAVERLIN